MFKKSLFLAIFCISVMFSLSACDQKVNLKIVSPQSNLRVTDDYVEGAKVPVAVVISYKGTYDRVTANIFSNNQFVYACDLISGVETNCGSLQLSNVGGQNLKVQVQKSNGELVEAVSNFRWEPYVGLEKFANDFSGVFGPKSVSKGYLLLFVIALLITFTIVAVVAISNKFSISFGAKVSATGLNGISGTAEDGFHFGPSKPSRTTKELAEAVYLMSLAESQRPAIQYLPPPVNPKNHSQTVDAEFEEVSDSPRLSSGVDEPVLQTDTYPWSMGQSYIQRQ